MKVEPKGREGRKNVFQLSYCSEQRGLGLSCHKKNIYNVPDDSNALSPETEEMTH